MLDIAIKLSYQPLLMTDNYWHIVTGKGSGPLNLSSQVLSRLSYLVTSDWTHLITKIYIYIKGNYNLYYHGKVKDEKIYGEL